MIAKPFQATGRIEKGKLLIRSAKRMTEALSFWRDCEVTVTIERRHAIRSIKANKYYFGVCLRLLSEHTGYTVDELHEWAKAKFLPKRILIQDSDGIVHDDTPIGGTTTTLNRVQFYDYVEQIRQFAAEELSVVIPDPDPNWRQEPRPEPTAMEIQSSYARVSRVAGSSR